MEKQTHIPKASESYILKKTKIYQINIYHINVGIEPRNHVKLGSPKFSICYGANFLK